VPYGPPVNRKPLWSNCEAEVAAAGKSQEWDASTTILAAPGSHPGMTVEADRGYDTGEFVDRCRGLSIIPHVAQISLRSAIDGKTTNSRGYRISQMKRKRIEEYFGWKKGIGLLRKLRHVGRTKTAWIFRFTAAAYSITRLKGLIA
jgi:hypothetical protein